MKEYHPLGVTNAVEGSYLPMIKVEFFNMEASDFPMIEIQFFKMVAGLVAGIVIVAETGSNTVLWPHRSVAVSSTTADAD